MPDLFDEGFFVREPAWHGKGLVLDDYPGREEAMRLAGHAFTVGERQVVVVDGEQGKVAEGWKALVREDTGDLLHVARDSYSVIQNQLPWDVVDALVADPAVKYDTAGVLDRGAVLWVTARVDEPARVKGDPSPVYPFVAAWWSHDGTGAFTVDQTTVRRVCANTHKAARRESDATGRTYTFRHVGQVADRIAAAKDALAGARTGFRAFLELADDLAALEVSDDGLEAFVHAFLPMPPEAAISDRVKGNVEEARGIVRANLNGPTCEGIRNTAWGLTCSAIEYLDYGRGYRSDRSLLNRTILRGERAKDEVVTLARKAAELHPAGAR